MEDFFSKKLLFIVAHPDDESFSAAGVMYKNSLCGGENYIISATLGEKGKAHLKRPVTESRLKQIRKQELEKAARFLKVRGLYFLGLPDTKVAERMRELEKKLLPLVKTIKPDYIFSFGPSGSSGHLDHIAVSKMSRKIASRFKIPFLAFALSPFMAKRFGQFTKRRKHGKYAKTIKFEKPNLKIKIDLPIKAKVIKFHKSQMGMSTLFDSVPRKSKRNPFEYEYFVRMPV